MPFNARLFAPVLQERTMGTTLFLREKPSADTSFLRLQDRIGYLFNNPNLLERALTHPSSTPHANSDNERMEFLGDSVVNLCVAQALYEWHPDWSEGDLTKVKSCVVSTQGLARAA